MKPNGYLMSDQCLDDFMIDTLGTGDSLARELGLWIYLNHYIYTRTRHIFLKTKRFLNRNKPLTFKRYEKLKYYFNNTLC